MQQYHISFMMSSLLYAGSTLGSVSFILCDITSGLPVHRFMIGTMLVESIVNQLGRFDPSKNAWSWVPQMNLFRHIFARDRSKKNPAFSPSQARFLSLLVSSSLHAMFFVVMGIARGGFWVLFFAYALAAFSRSILTGENSPRKSALLTNLSDFQLLCNSYPCWHREGVLIASIGMNTLRMVLLNL